MLRRLFAILLALVVAIIVVGFLLPASVTVERERVIEQPRESIFDVLADLGHFTRWSPWFRREPRPEYRLEGPPSGAGATLVWDEQAEHGANRLWIVETDPPRRIDMRLELGGSDARSWFSIEPGERGQRVRWGMRMDFGTFDLVGRYVGIMLPGLVGRDYEAGLESLDAYLADGPGEIPDLEESGDPAYPGSGER